MALSPSMSLPGLRFCFTLPTAFLAWPSCPGHVPLQAAGPGTGRSPISADEIFFFFDTGSHSVITAPCSIKLLGSSDPPAPVSQVAGTTNAHHHNWLIFFLILVQTGSHSSSPLLRPWRRPGATQVYIKSACQNCQVTSSYGSENWSQGG